MPTLKEKFLKERSGDVYRSLVVSLFSDTKILVTGVLGLTLAIGVTAHATGSLMLWGIAAACFLAGLVRIAVNFGFHRACKLNGLSDEAARFWETWFTVGVSFQALIAGLWVLVACWTSSAVAQNASLAVTFGLLIGVCCRSYPFKRLVKTQVFLIFVPMWIGLSHLGGYHAIFGGLLTLYIMSASKIAGGLRKVLLENIFQREKAERNAQKFDSALNNLPHGVCLFNEHQRLEVINDHISKNLGKTAQSLIGLSVTDVVAVMSRDHDLSDRDAAVLIQWANSGNGTELKHTMELGTDVRRSIKCCASPTAAGGSIVTLEDITKEVAAEREMEHMRRFDRLTGLYNRLFFTAQLHDALKQGQGDETTALLLLSLCRFKQVNDALGHNFGDMLLCEATARIKRVCPEALMISRYGGNEFAIALRDADAADLSIMIADTLLSVLDQPFDIDGRVVHLGASIGIAKAEEAGATKPFLTDRAGLALDAAKRQGGRTVVEYDEAMGKDAQNRRKLESDLRGALERGELEAHFQPLVSVAHHRVATFEALMRWKHPVLGYVSPIRFVQIAEEIGIIAQLGSWMLEESCRVCKTWPAPTRVAVNLSPLQFAEGNIVEVVREALAKTGLEPTRLELEITESLVLHDLEETIDTLEKFKEMGIRISLDDFGTGYSCLSYLSQLPLDKVKIDRSFVSDIEPNTKALTLLKAVSGLGHQLGLSVVVEGVETQRELSVLLEHVHVDEIQGYLFSKPVPHTIAQTMFAPKSEMQGKLDLHLAPSVSQVA